MIPVSVRILLHLLTTGYGTQRRCGLIRDHGEFYRVSGLSADAFSPPPPMSRFGHDLLYFAAMRNALPARIVVDSVLGLRTSK